MGASEEHGAPETTSPSLLPEKPSYKEEIYIIWKVSWVVGRVMLSCQWVLLLSDQFSPVTQTFWHYIPAGIFSLSYSWAQNVELVLHLLQTFSLSFRRSCLTCKNCEYYTYVIRVYNLWLVTWSHRRDQTDISDHLVDVSQIFTVLFSPEPNAGLNVPLCSADGR